MHEIYRMLIVQNVWFQLTSILLLSSMELDQCLPAAIPSLTFKQLPRWSHLFGWTMLVIALPINNDGLTIREGMKELLGQTASGVTTLQWRSIGIWLTVVSLAITTFRLTKRYFIAIKWSDIWQVQNRNLVTIQRYFMEFIRLKAKSLDNCFEIR